MILGLAPSATAWTVSAGLLFGLLILAAVMGGRMAHALKAPRVVGYLACGAVLKIAILAGLGISAEQYKSHALARAERPLDAIVSLALGLILFTIGSVFEVRHLKVVRSYIGRLALGDSVVTFVFVFIAVLGAVLVTRSMLDDDTITVGVAVAFALLLASGSIATAPAATLFVLREYDSKGPVTDTVLSLVGINNLVCIVMFQISFVALVATGALETVSLSGGAVWLELGISLLGSLVIGLVLGVVMAIAHARLLRTGDVVLVLIGLLLLLAGAAEWLTDKYGFADILLLSCLIAGAVFANVAIDADRLHDSVRSIGQPIFVGFFVIAGYRLHLGALPELGLIGVAYLGARGLGKVVGIWLGVRWAGPRRELRPYIGCAMLCQAAVIIGLARFVENNWNHPWASASFATTVFGSVALFEMIGPLLTKWVVVHAGEVKVATLLRRSTTSMSTASALRLTLESLRRSLGLKPRGTITSDGPMLVRHIMRANIKTLPASAPFDEVLHFVEHSRFNDFPVVNDRGELVGVIHFADIRQVIYDPDLSDLVTAADLVAVDTRAVPAEMPIESVLTVFRSGSATSLPVYESDDARLVIGIVEQRDVLRALHRTRTDA